MKITKSLGRRAFSDRLLGKTFSLWPTMNDFQHIPDPARSIVPSGIPPQNIEAEQAVLGSILLKSDLLGAVLEILTPQDFYKNNHRLIYEAMIDLFEKNEPQDLLTVSNSLKNTNKLEHAGGPTYLASLTSIVPVTANVSKLRENNP